MIKKNDKEIVGVFKGTTEISAVYKGLVLVYQNAKTMIAEGVPPITVLNALAKVLLGYRVYGNSIQDGTPTPDTPIEIESVGNKTKNLWNSTLRVGCMKFADGQYLDYPGYVCNATPIPVKAGETYTLSADNYTDPDLTSAGFVFYNNGTFVSSLITASLTVTIPAGVNQLYYDFRHQSSPSQTPTDITNVQLEKGSSATSYEPYGYKIPITVSGKNICNPNSFTNTGKLLDGINGGLNNNANYKTTDYIFIKSGTYTLSLDNTYDGTVSTTTCMCLYNTNYGYTGNAVSDTSVRPTRPSYTFTVSNDCYYRLSVRNTDTNVQIEKSATETTYEPYVAPRTTNIYLNQPLRKIGNYIDYIDFENQKVYRNVGIDNITKDSSIGKFSGVTNYSAFYMAYDNLPDYDGTFKNLTLLSPTFTYHKAGGGNINQYWTANYQISSAIAEGYKRILFTLPSTITDTTSAKTWLETNPIEFYYPKKIASEESITLPNILLNKGTNIISIDTNINASNMWIKYKGKA